MHHTLVWISLCFGFGCPQLPHRKYFYVDMRVTFPQAQAYCRENFTDVATITSSQDISMLTRLSSNQAGVWIGLNDDPTGWKGVMGNNTNSWRWSLTGQMSKTSYCNWKPGQPDFTGAYEACVVSTNIGQWVDISCATNQQFVCFDTNATGKSFVLITTPLTWTDAQTYCRQHHKDLALIENADDTNAIQSLSISDIAWIGLYRVPWFWSDYNNSTFRNFAAGKPNNDQWINYCVAELPDHTWTDTPCAPLLAFFCHKDTQLKTMLRITSQTNADMTDPAINAQILQQIGAALKNRGWNLLELQWKIQPRKMKPVTFL